MRYLKTNTATIVTVGPFFDKTDGVTIETGLTISNERITFVVDANDGSAPTLVLDNVTGATSGTSNDLNYITNNDAGLMQLELAAANVNYLGRAMLTITDAANHVPVFHEFMILPAVVYDALVAGTDYLTVDAVQVEGADATDQIRDAVVDDATRIDASALNTASGTSIPAILADTGTDGVVVAAASKTGYTLTATTGLGNQTANITGNLSGSVGSVTGAVGSVAPGGITAASIATNAIDADAIATDAVTELQSGLATAANLATLTGYVDTEVAAILAAVDTEVAAIKTKTDYLPSATAGAAGGLFIAGSNAATTVNITGNVTGNLSGSVGSVTGAVGSVTGAVGSVTGNVGGDVAGSVASVTNAVTVGTNNDKTGYSLSAAGVQAIWDALTSALTTVGSVGKRIADNLDGTVSSRSSHSAADVWAAATRTLTSAADSAGVTTLLSRIVGTLAAGTHNAQSGDAYARLGAPAGASVSADVAAVKAQTAAIEADTQDLQTQVGTDGAGLTAIGDTRIANLDATVSSRLAAASYTAPLDAAGTRTAIGLATANLDTQLAGLPTDADVQAAATAALNAYDPPTNAEMEARTLAAASYATAAALDAVDNYVDTEIAAIKAKTDNLPSDPADQSAVEAAITAATSTLATAANLATLAGYVDTEVAAIKAKTDNLPASPAAVGDIPSAASIADAVWDEAIAGHAVAGSTGAALSAATAPSAAAVADAVWDEALSGHAVAGSAGAALSAAGTAGDPWSTALPGAYGAGTAGKLLSDIKAVAPDNKPTVAATGEASANVTMHAGVAVAAADLNGNVPVDVKLWKGVTINDLVDGNVVVKLADVAHGGSAATLNLKKLSLINPTDNDPALYLEAKHTPVVQSYAPLTVLGRFGWEISDGMAVALYPALVTEETLRSNLRIVTGALSDPVGMTATVDQDLYGTDAYVGWMLFLEYLDRGLNRWAAKVVSHTATTITLDDTIPGAGTFWLLPATGLSAQQTRDAMKLAPTAGDPAAGSVDAHLDALALEATAQAILEDTGTTLPTAIAAIEPGGGSYAGDGIGYYSDTIDDGTSPLDGVRVQLYTSPNRVGPAYEAYTNALGVFEMWPDPGTYYRWLDLAGYNFSQDVAVTVTEP